MCLSCASLCCLHHCYYYYYYYLQKRDMDSVSMTQGENKKTACIVILEAGNET